MGMSISEGIAECLREHIATGSMVVVIKFSVGVDRCFGNLDLAAGGQTGS